MEKIINEFKRLDPVKQVVVYAESLNAEFYELLAVLDKCIPKHKKQEFLRAVELYNS